MAKHSLESHTIRIHPKLWEWAQADAVPCGYEGGASALIAGLILYNHGLKKRRHWLTADAVNDVDKLEQLMKEIEQHDALGDSGTWWEHRMQELFLPQQKEEP